MKTLLITELFPPRIGGSIRFYWEIYRRMPSKNLVIAAGEDPGQDAFDRTHDLPVVRVPLTFNTRGIRSFAGLAGYWRGFSSLKRVVNREPIGLMQCGRVLPEGLMALGLNLMTRIPYGLYVWGEELASASTSRELTLLARRVLHRAKFISTCSVNSKRILTEQWGISSDRIRLLYPGVDIDRFVPAERSLTVRARLGWGNRPVVLTVARLQKRKGHDQMILALKRIREAVPDVLFAVVGDGEERPYLESLVAREGHQNHVLFMGAVHMDDPRLIECYQQCDIFALPNRVVDNDIEGFGMVLVEAQACGKPVIGGICGGTAETMQIPETGRIVDCNGPDELARVISEWLRDTSLREKMGRSARAWVVQRFDWSVLSRQAQRNLRSAS